MFKKIKSFLFENTTASQTIAKNTIWLTISNFGGRLIKVALILYAARVLGTAGYGLFSYAVTLAGFLGLFMDPGINTALMRDSAKAPGDEERYAIFSTTFLIKILLLVAGLLIIIFLAPLFTTLPGAKALLPIVAFILMFDTLREFFASLLRSREKMEWEAAIFIFTNIAIVVFGFIFIMWRPTAKSLGWGYAAGTVLGACAAIVVVWDYVKKAWSHFSSKLVVPIIQTAWPFAVVGALGLLLTNMDILIISWLKTASDVGIYSAAIRIIQVMYLVPGVLQLSTLPLFSRLAKKDNPRFRLALERTVSLLFVVSIPVALGGIVLGTQVMSLLFGSAFAPGGLSLRILMITMIVDYPGSMIVNAIFAYGHQKSLIITSAIGGVSNVILDLLLIPRFGITGSAVATLIAQTLSNGYLWYVMKGLNYFTILPYLKKILGASLVMFIVTLGLFYLHMNVLLNILVSIIVYFGVLKLLGEPLLKEMYAVIPFGKKASEAI